MIDLTLSKETGEYATLARDFASNELINNETDDEQSRFPHKALESAWNLGLLYGRIPEELGGLSLSFADQCILLEEIAFGSPSVALTLAISELAVSSLLYAGTKSQQEHYLPELLSNFQLFGIVHATTDVLSTNGSRNPDQATAAPNTALSGKGFTGINCQHASWILTASQLSNSNNQLFLIPKASAALKTGPRKNILGLRQADICAIDLENISIPEVNTIKMTPSQSTKWLASAQLLLATIACGINNAALQHSIVYSKERQTFGKPIHSYQSISFMMADMAKDLNAARLMIRKGAKFLQPNMSEHADILGYASATHAFACEAAMKATTDAVQIFGGYGYSKEYPVEKLMRDAKMLQLLLFSTHISRYATGNTLLCANP